ncbi:hypothetical protein H7U40_09820 [Flavonifractor plautii]|uniref:hypothetical protein n=1 Tax=Flavonifractor plautii TaxID=292800 RepID=UPI0019567C71|nr:hypothetical protein [Flavonifractor plautii]MBM6790560.1 hypothetical protein [Flavonifractor plautii]
MLEMCVHKTQRRGEPDGNDLSACYEQSTDQRQRTHHPVPDREMKMEGFKMMLKKKEGKIEPTVEYIYRSYETLYYFDVNTVTTLELDC